GLSSWSRASARRRGARHHAAASARPPASSRTSARSRPFLRLFRTSALAIAAEKAVLGAGVRVEVVGDVAHVTVHPELAELGGRDLGETGPHAGHVLEIGR